jgi:hypothetical protein
MNEVEAPWTLVKLVMRSQYRSENDMRYQRRKSDLR